MNLTGTPDQIIATIAKQHIHINAVLERARATIPAIKVRREISEYQAAALYALAEPYNQPGKRILEIGTALGYSASILGQACPDAEIITLNPNSEEVAQARAFLAGFPNITVIEQLSWDYLDSKPGHFDFIFVDGDHKNVRQDLPFWDLLNAGGAMVFHDYSPEGTWRACPPVFEAVNEFAGQLGKPAPDILIVDDRNVGMAGFYKQSAKQQSSKVTFALAQAHASSVLSWRHIDGLYELGKQVKEIDGAVVECGVGGSAIALWYGAGANKPLWLFDTFAGVPIPSQRDGGKCMARYQTRQAAGGWCVVEEDEYKDILKRVKIPAKYIHLVKADWRVDVTLLPPMGTFPIALLHIDVTIWDSTFAALQRFYPDVLPGGLVTVSAYGHWDGVREATNEYFATLGEHPQWHILDGVNVWMKKA